MKFDQWMKKRSLPHWNTPTWTEVPRRANNIHCLQIIITHTHTYTIFTKHGATMYGKFPGLIAVGSSSSSFSFILFYFFSSFLSTWGTKKSNGLMRRGEKRRRICWRRSANCWTRGRASTNVLKQTFLVKQNKT